LLIALLNALRSILAVIVGIVLALLFGLWPALKRLIKALRALLRKLLGTAARELPPVQASCVPIRHPSMKRPNPTIYDQYYLMSLGLAVSWQNPDIKILQGGVPVASAYDLAPSTTYTIRATIYNLSTTGVVHNMPIVFSYLSFGVGTQSHLIPGPDPLVSLGVKGSPLGIAIVEKDWTTPSVPGHYCVQVSFAYFDDINPFNNLGQENTQVVQAASPAPFSFQLRNTRDEPAKFRFEADTFSLPAQPQCSTKTTAPPNGTVSAATRRRNSRADNPLPPDWSIQFTPAAPALGPGEEITIDAIVTPPDNFHGTMPVNVHTFSGDTLAGGVTVLVQRA
jgi:hypothetical protein